jgi:hypothetical protein
VKIREKNALKLHVIIFINNNNNNNNTNCPLMEVIVGIERRD